MGNDLNLCQFIGRLGKEPEIRYTQGGDAVANFSIAVGESWKNKAGEKVEKVEWVRCVAWRRLAEIIGEYLTKGSQVYVSGKFQTRSWDQDGVKKYMTEIMVLQMQMLGGGSSSKEKVVSPKEEYSTPPLPDDDDILF